MKTTKPWLKKFTSGVGLTTLSLLVFAGCATKLSTPGTPAQPAQTVTQITPATATAPAVTNYIIVPAVPAVPGVVTGYTANAAVTTAVGYANAAAPLVPAPWGSLLTGVASLAALVAGYVAQKKNTQLAAANDAADSHAAAAAAMASVIQNNPTLTAQAMTAAQSNGSVALVATHIASAGSPT